jgi:hypothetical protein
MSAQPNSSKEGTTTRKQAQFDKWLKGPEVAAMTIRVCAAQPWYDYRVAVVETEVVHNRYGYPMGASGYDVLLHTFGTRYAEAPVLAHFNNLREANVLCELLWTAHRVASNKLLLITHVSSGMEHDGNASATCPECNKSRQE